MKKKKVIINTIAVILITMGVGLFTYMITPYLGTIWKGIVVGWDEGILKLVLVVMLIGTGAFVWKR